MAKRAKGDSEGIPVQCHRCGHRWIYTGRKRELWSIAICPECRTTVGLRKFLESKAA